MCNNSRLPCGDGFMQEECDDGNTVTETCARRGFRLVSGCLWRYCPKKGDGNTIATDDCSTRFKKEACDDAEQNDFVAAFGDARMLKLNKNSDFVAPRCGDGTVDDGEVCDDGNDQAGDFCDGCQETQWTAPLLVLLIDFSDTDTDARLPESELRWSGLMFGNEQGEANHYWDEVLGGRFTTEPAIETAGNVDDGVIRIRLPYPWTNTLTEDQPWLPDALDAASAFMDFQAYDTNGGVAKPRSVFAYSTLTSISMAVRALRRTSILGIQLPTPVLSSRNLLVLVLVHRRKRT